MQILQFSGTVIQLLSGHLNGSHSYIWVFAETLAELFGEGSLSYERQRPVFPSEVPDVPLGHVGEAVCVTTNPDKRGVLLLWQSASNSSNIAFQTFCFCVHNTTVLCDNEPER